MLIFAAATTLGESTAITASVTVGIPDVEQMEYSVTGKSSGFILLALLHLISPD